MKSIVFIHVCSRAIAFLLAFARSLLCFHPDLNQCKSMNHNNRCPLVKHGSEPLTSVAETFFLRLQVVTNVTPLTFIYLYYQTLFADCMVDLVFLMDGSWSIGKRRFKIQKDFLSEVAQVINVGVAGPMMGVIQYG